MNKTKQKYQDKLEVRRELLRKCEDHKRNIDGLVAEYKLGSVHVTAALCEFGYTIDRIRENSNLGGTSSFKFYQNYYNKMLETVA